MSQISAIRALEQSLVHPVVNAGTPEGLDFSDHGLEPGTAPSDRDNVCEADFRPVLGPSGSAFRSLYDGVPSSPEPTYTKRFSNNNTGAEPKVFAAPDANVSAASPEKQHEDKQSSVSGSGSGRALTIRPPPSASSGCKSNGLSEPQIVANRSEELLEWKPIACFPAAAKHPRPYNVLVGGPELEEGEASDAEPSRRPMEIPLP